MINRSYNLFLNKLIECWESCEFIESWHHLTEYISKFSRTEYNAMSDFITAGLRAVEQRIRTETEYKDAQVIWRGDSFIAYTDSHAEYGIEISEMFNVFDFVVDHLYTDVWECGTDETRVHQTWLKNKLTAFDTFVNEYFEVTYFIFRCCLK